MRRLNLSAPVRALCSVLSATLLFLSAGAVHAATSSQAPGGFLENDYGAAVRTPLTAAQIASFVPPTRGGFTFPAPYGTQGVRVTQPSDCGGQDCVDMIYSYWRNMSNSTGSDTMYIFIGLDRARGGQGPTLFQYTKSTGQLTDVGPLFASTSPYSWDSGEGWYFSYSKPTKIYMQDGSKLLRYDVLAKTFETVFDSTTAYPGTVIHQTNSSNDDDVHSATLENATTYSAVACIAYKASTNHFYYFAVQGKFDECQIDKSGRYLLIKELLPSDPCTSCDEDNLIEDLQTGTETVLLDKDGAGGHSDMGYGWYVSSDNWNANPNAWRLWDFSEPLTNGLPTTVSSQTEGGLLFYGSTWGMFEPSHVSFENATTAPINTQYACGAGVNTSTSAADNDIRCFMLDGSVPQAQLQSLIVAPSMSSLSATGGTATCPSCVGYAQDPKGNIDPTGQYYFWTSNTGGPRIDAYMVRIPSQVLTGTNPTGSVQITSPSNGSTVTGSVTATATVPAGSNATGVTFTVDNGGASTATAAPYQATWTSLSPGQHTISATMTMANGSTAAAAPVDIMVENAVSGVSGTGSTSSSISSGTSGASSSGAGSGAKASGGGGAAGLLCVVLFGLMALGRRVMGSR